MAEYIMQCTTDMDGVDCYIKTGEVVRCKECKYYEWMSNRIPEEQTWYCHNWNAETGKDDYCSYGKRKGADE